MTSKVPTPSYPFEEMQSRTRLLVGDRGIEHFQQAHILLVGAGGVGGAVAHMLVRAGIGALTIVDGDKVATSNLNRQMVSYQDTVGMYKTEALGQELLRINPGLNLTLRTTYLEVQDIAPLFSTTTYSFVADAIDTLAPKTELIAYCYEHGIPLISSMGAGAKIDPTALRIADIGQTHTCSLAKAVRKNLRARGIRKGIPVVFSSEIALEEAIISSSTDKGKRSTVGTISYLPNLFGGFMAGYILRSLSGL